MALPCLRATTPKYEHESLVCGYRGDGYPVRSFPSRPRARFRVKSRPHVDLGRDVADRPVRSVSSRRACAPACSRSLEAIDRRALRPGARHCSRWPRRPPAAVRCPVTAAGALLTDRAARPRAQVSWRVPRRGSGSGSETLDQVQRVPAQPAAVQLNRLGLFRRLRDSRGALGPRLIVV
jgi:hypothetical protein